MITADFVNGAFEVFAGIAILNHCRAIWRDRQVKGISIVSVLFFTAWGYWNLYYYPSLGQWWSFIGGLGVVFANTVWVSLLVWYGVYLPRRLRTERRAGILQTGV